MTKQPVYYTTDTKRLCPYPNMTEMDLCDFERYCDEMDERHSLHIKDNFWAILLIIGFFSLILLECSMPEIRSQ